MEAFIYGIFFGLINGLSPGPTLTMVITQTLQYNVKEGIKIALSPVIFGIIVIPFSVLILSQFSSIKFAMLVISVLGALYLFYLGYQLITCSTVDLKSEKNIASFKKGMLINFTSPYAYIFWFTVGAPFLVRSLHESIIYSLIFIIFYYLFLIGSKIAIAIIIDKAKTFLNETFYTYILKLLGVALFLCAYFTLREGIS